MKFNSETPYTCQTLKLSPKWKREAIQQLINFFGDDNLGNPAKPDLEPLRKTDEGWELDVVFTDDRLAKHFASALASREIGLH